MSLLAKVCVILALPGIASSSTAKKQTEIEQQEADVLEVTVESSYADLKENVAKALGTVKAGIVESLEDESCLLQTKQEIRRHPEAQKKWEDKDENKDGEDAGDEEAYEYEELGYLGTQSGTRVPRFEIDLDLPPEERFAKVAAHYKDQFVHFLEIAGSNSTSSLSLQHNMINYRGEENSEMQAELEGIAKVLGSDVEQLHAGQLISSFQEMKGPFFRYLQSKGKPIPSDEKMLKTMSNQAAQKQLPQFGLLQTNITSDPEFLKRMPSFGCTGILAKDSRDGSVWQARNFDFGFGHYVENMTHHAVFTRKGKELFTAQMTFPMLDVLTAMKRGKNGYGYAYNTRYGDSNVDTQILMANLFMLKRPLSSWSIRKAIEENDNYESFVEAMSTVPLPNKQYAVISGVKKGVVLARDPDGVAYKMELDDEHPTVVMTNYDWKTEDPKEWLNNYTTAGVSNRVRAQNLLQESGGKISPRLLMKILADKDVATDDTSGSTIYQALMNVEHNTYKSSLPRTRHSDCDGIPEDCKWWEDKAAI